MTIAFHLQDNDFEISIKTVMQSNSCYSIEFDQVDLFAFSQLGKVQSPGEKRKRLIAAAAVVALATIAPARAEGPLMIVKNPDVVGCKYLLAMKTVSYWVVKKNWEEARKAAQNCLVLRIGTRVSADDSDGGEFVGVTIKDGEHNGSLVWTYSGWLELATAHAETNAVPMIVGPNVAVACGQLAVAQFVTELLKRDAFKQISEIKNCVRLPVGTRLTMLGVAPGGYVYAIRPPDPHGIWTRNEWLQEVK